MKIAIFCPHKLIELFKHALIKERCLEVIFIYEENCIPLKHEYNFDRNKDFSYDFLVEFGVDLAIVYYWNHLIPKQILDEICFFNIHPSMLPKYRGPHPVIFQLLNKEKYLGVTMHKMDETYDTGEIFLQESVEIDYDNIRFLDIKIFRIAKEMIIQLINDYRSGSIVLTKQLDGDATYFSSNDLSCILNNEIYYADFIWMMKIFDIYKPLRIYYNEQIYNVVDYDVKPFKDSLEFNLKDKRVYLKISDKDIIR